MARNSLPLDGLSADAKKIVLSATFNTPGVAEIPLVLSMPGDWTLKQLLVSSNNASVDITFTVKVDGGNGTGYTAVTYDDNSSIGTVTADLDIDSDEPVSLNLTSVSDPGILVFTLIGEYR